MEILKFGKFFGTKLSKNECEVLVLNPGVVHILVHKFYASIKTL